MEDAIETVVPVIAVQATIRQASIDLKASITIDVHVEFCME